MQGRSRGVVAERNRLTALARVAAFSPFHFHRVFAAITGEIGSRRAGNFFLAPAIPSLPPLR